MFVVEGRVSLIFFYKKKTFGSKILKNIGQKIKKTSDPTCFDLYIFMVVEERMVCFLLNKIKCTN